MDTKKIYTPNNEKTIHEIIKEQKEAKRRQRKRTWRKYNNGN